MQFGPVNVPVINTTTSNTEAISHSEPKVGIGAVIGSVIGGAVLILCSIYIFHRVKLRTSKHIPAQQLQITSENSSKVGFSVP
jgi:Ca2+/Na+ antiporter